MASVWKVEVFYQISGDALPAAAGYGSIAAAPSLGAVLVARDATGANSRWWAIVMSLEWVVTPAYVTRAELRFGANYTSDSADFTNNGTLLTTIDLADGGAAFLSGGTISMEKDQTADELRFVTPAGSWTESLSAHSMQNANAMYGNRLEFWQEPAGGIASLTNVAHWSSFYTTQDTTRVRGAAMSDNLPGVWDGSWTYLVLENIANKTHTQDLTEDLIELAWATPMTTLGRTRVERTWNGGNVVYQVVRELDMTQAPEHGAIFRVFAYSATPDFLRCQRSFDDGLTWTEFIVHSGLVFGAPAVVYTPCIEWYGGKLIVVWDAGGVIVQQISRNFGVDWTDPIAIRTTSGGVKPRLPGFFVHPDHGLSFFFYVDQISQKLFLKRSGDFGVTFLDAGDGILIYTGSALTYVDAWVAANGIVRVRFQDASGGQTGYWSHSLGSNWELDVNWTRGSAGDNRYHTVSDRRLGLTHHSYFGPPDVVYGYASADAGTLATPTFVEGVVDILAAEHTPAIAMTADGGTVVSYFLAPEVLSNKKSRNFSQDWS